jgi:hypothetical protein
VPERSGGRRRCRPASGGSPTGSRRAADIGKIRKRSGGDQDRRREACQPRAR